MKTKTYKFLIFSIFSSILLISIACDKKKESILETEVSRRWILSDFEKYETFMQERQNFKKGTYFDILDINRNGNKLKINVEGGCNTAAYKIYWNGKLDFSKSLVANLMIAYESDIAIKCEKPLTKHSIDVDLYTIIGKEYEPNMSVLISNSTKVSDKLIDAKGVVTIKN